MFYIRRFRPTRNEKRRTKVTKNKQEFETFDDNDPKTCRAIIYIEAPKMLIPKRLLDSIMWRNQEELGTTVGHVFLGIVDEKGEQECLGLHARVLLPGEKENCPENERTMTTKQMAFRSMTGMVVDNSKEPYDDCIIYKISRAQYDKIKEFTEAAKKNPPRYNILTSNCVNFTYAALRQADLKLPPQMFIASPHISSLNARAIERGERAKHKLARGAIKLGEWFSDRKLVKLGKKLAQFGIDIVKDTTKVIAGIGVGSLTKMRDAGTSVIDYTKGQGLKKPEQKNPVFKLFAKKGLGTR